MAREKSAPLEAPAEHTIEVDGNPVTYRRAGDGRPVLFLHGAGLSRAWLPFHDLLSQRHDLIAPQHPGFGGTPLPAHFRSFTDLTLHYDALTRALELDRPHLVATSFGGRIAAHLASTYPERFASLTLIVPAGLRGDGPRPDPFRQTPREAIDRLTNDRADRIPSLDIDTTDHEFIVESYREDTAFALFTFTERYDRDLPHRLGRIGIPTLVLDAEEDRVLGAGAAQRYADLIPSARHVVIDGPVEGEASSHAMHVEQFVDISAVVLQHISDAEERN